MFVDGLVAKKDKLLTNFKENRKRFVLLGFFAVFLFLTIVYVGPFGGLEKLGLIGQKKESEQSSLAATVPNDSQFSAQWALVKIRAKDAWDITKGSKSVKVAILGSGVDSAHRDLSANMIPGYNSINPAADTHDEFGFGTMAAGIIGAVGNNSQDVAGINWQVSVLPVKVCITFDCNAANLARGIRWAADNGAQVIDVSSSSSTDPTGEIASAVTYAQTKGAIIVAVAFRLPGAGLWFPGRLPNVVTVTDTDQNDQIIFSQSQDAALDIVAPGDNIISTWPNNRTQSLGGSDLAAAHVSGVLALLLSKGATPTAAVDAIYQGAVDLGAVGRDNIYGAGRLDACGALNAAGFTCPVGSNPTPVATPIITPTPAPSAIPTITPLPTPAPTSTPNPTPIPTSGIKGLVVVGGWNKSLIVGAHIEVTNTGKSYLTDSQGRYTTDNLPAGTYLLTVSAIGYVNQSAVITVSGGFATKDFVLTKIP